VVRLKPDTAYQKDRAIAIPPFLKNRLTEVLARDAANPVAVPAFATAIPAAADVRPSAAQSTPSASAPLPRSDSTSGIGMSNGIELELK
jgi:hypothetical protein